MGNNDENENRNKVELKMSRKRSYSSAIADDGWAASSAIEANHPGDEEPMEDSAPAPKYREIESGYVCRLDHFCDEVLYEIFKYLDSWSLRALMNTCTRFKDFVLDKRFWVDVDFSKEPLPLGILEDVLERTHAGTKLVKLHGPPPETHVEGEIQQFSRTLMSALLRWCGNLKHLQLQGITLDFNYIRLREFPKTLKRFVFIDCKVRVPDSLKNMFVGIDSNLPELEELGIEYCDWFEPYYLMAISKMRSLRWLSLRGCKHLVDFVQYGSLSARFGFKRLEFLDMRFSPLTDSDLQCFSAVTTLKEIRLDCPEHLRRIAEKNDKKSNISQNCVESSDNQPSTSAAAAAQAAAAMAGNAGRGLFGAWPHSQAESSQRRDTGKDPQMINISQNPSSGSSSLSNSSSSSSPSDLTGSNNGNSNSSPSPSPSPSPGPGLNNNDDPTRNNPPQEHRDLPEVVILRPIDLGEGEGQNGGDIAAAIAGVGGARPPAAAGAAANGDNNNNPPLGGPAWHHLQYYQYPRHLRHRGGHLYIVPGYMVHRGAPPQAAPIAPRREHDVDEVLRHELFWNMISPLRNFRSSSNNHHAHSRSFISDRGVCCFGRPPNPADENIIWIRAINRPPENAFERLSVRNYRRVTDISLLHLVQCSPNLVYLDLSGTNVTRQGVQNFKKRKPDCEVIADHLIDEDDDGIDTVSSPADELTTG